MPILCFNLNIYGHYQALLGARLKEILDTRMCLSQLQ